MCRYGTETLSDIEGKAEQQCTNLGFGFEALQSNHEGVLIDRIHAARADGTAAIVINAGAYTHTSVAIRDALSGVKVPFIEVHVSRFISPGGIGTKPKDEKLYADHQLLRLLLLESRFPTSMQGNLFDIIRIFRTSPVGSLWGWERSGIRSRSMLWRRRSRVGLGREQRLLDKALRRKARMQDTASCNTRPTKFNLICG